MENDAWLCFKSHSLPGYISSGKVVYGADDKHPERIFSTFVAMFIEEGILYFTEGDAAYTLKPGEWFIQTPGIRHYGHQAGGVKTVFHFVHFLPQGQWQIETHASRREQAALPVRQLDRGDGVRLPQFEIQLPMRGIFPISDWQALFMRLQTEHAQGGRGDWPTSLFS
ncbi:AraC family ligand binding domain-containing protein [Cohnella ginsengisoli]|uniref:AraC family ligand binding domain-containing protein n=1 Tax=Cohnella ginsengisoli TaxID=425004 RepID=A0A9X4QQ16_9BACL|nr:AraC family ligand binding domain-containing protein [Cohnella ginsengisoli]MDG0794092.1 AraC family ligand binding domain-containing protein [Cohnella ginsengisoli]